MVAIYTRQSVDRADSISVELQAETCRAKLTVSELETCETYTDKGFSGKNINRPALRRLMEDVAEGRVEKILVYKIDRISRSVHDFTGLCQQLSEKGVEFQSVTDGITLDDSLSGTVMAQIMMVFAQFERETIQRRVTDNYFGRAKTGMYLGGRPPFGFAKGETTVGGKRTACYIPAPEQAAWVIRMFERYRQDGESLGTLSRWLNAKGLRTNTGAAWSTLPLGRLLRNPSYVRADASVFRYLQAKGATMNDSIEAYEGNRGCYCYAPLSTAHGGKKPTRNKFSDMSHSFVTLAPHEGLIDAELWLEVQHKLDRNRALKNSGAGTHSWLSGLMKCKHCGYAITVVNKPSNMHGHYINCGGHKRGNAICPGRSRVITLEDIESAVEKELLAFLASYRDVEMREKKQRSSEANRLEMQIGGLEQEMARLTLNLGQVMESDVVHILSSRIHEINGTLSELRRQRDALLLSAGAPDLDAYFRAVLVEWPDYGIPEKKKIAKAVLERVIVGDGAVEVVFRTACGNQKNAASQ